MSAPIGALGRAAGSPADALAAFQRGLAAQHAGQTAEATSAYREAIEIDPDLAPAFFNLGQILRGEGKHGPAAHAYERAARLRPGAPDAWLNLGICREQLGHLNNALVAYTEAARIDPSLAAAHFNSGNVRRKLGDLVGARAGFEEASRLEPNAAEVWMNLGNVLRELGELEEAIRVLRRAAELAPTWVEPRWNLSMALLAAGQLEEGWAEYEHRWGRVGLSGSRGFAWPRWRGEPLQGRRILIWREQGLGDEIQFATCVPDLVAQGARVTLAVDPRLVGLCGRSFPEATVVEDGAWGAGPFDFQLPLGSLPALLRRRRSDFQPAWNYLIPDRARIGAWTERLGTLGTAFKVGICWRSGVRLQERDRYYSELAAWRPLLELPALAFVSLQYDDAESELASVEASTGVAIRRWTGVDLKDDLEGVAALIWSLDLVITAPTAVASLSGALGIETWQIEPGTDWTTFGESRSPWLPAIRVFQRPFGVTDWASTIDAIAAELRARVAPNRRLLEPNPKE